MRVNLSEVPDLGRAILKANGYISHNNAAELFATLFAVAFDPGTGEIEYVSCGHLPALIRRASGEVESLPGGGLPVGMFETLRLRVRTNRLEPGDLLFLYTDGVTEAVDMGGEEFGDKRLLTLLAESDAGRADRWIERVTEAVREFSEGQPQSDDVTCLALKR